MISRCIFITVIYFVHVSVLKQTLPTRERLHHLCGCGQCCVKSKNIYLEEGCLYVKKVCLMLLLQDCALALLEQNSDPVCVCENIFVCWLTPQGTQKGCSKQVYPAALITPQGLMWSVENTVRPHT